MKNFFDLKTSVDWDWLGSDVNGRFEEGSRRE